MFNNIFDGNFLPHGYCLQWNPQLVVLFIVGNLLTALAYFSIPVALWIFQKKRKDLSYKWLFVLFALFITSCGLTHVAKVWTLYHSAYWLEAGLDLFTGLISSVTAVLLWRVLPLALKLPTPSEYIAQQQAALKMKQILNEIPIAIFTTDPDGKLSFKNPRYCETIGIDPEKNQETSSSFVVHPDDQANVLSITASNCKTGSEYDCRLKDNSKDEFRWYHVKIAPIFDNDRLVMGLGTCLDIDDQINQKILLQKKVEERTAELKDQAELLNLTHDSVLVRDLNGKITYWNKGSEELYGYVGDEAIGQTSFKLLQSDFPEDQRKEVHNTVMRDGRWQGKIVQFGKSGEEIHVDSKWSLKRDADGTPRSILEINRDITSQTRAFEQMTSLKNFYESVLDNMSEGVLVANQNWDIMMVNRAAKEAVKSMGEVPSKLPLYRNYVWYKSDGLPVETAQLPTMRAMNGEQIQSLELKLQHKETNESHWFELSASPFRMADLSMCGVTVFRDITARREYQSKLQSLTHRLNESNKELQNFAYAAAHDLQEPLRTISGFLDLLKHRSEATLDPQGLRYITIVMDSAERMRDLINDLLAYSRVEQSVLTLNKVPLDEAVDRALAALHQTIQETGPRIEREALPVVLGDLTQLSQVFQNLIGNAIKYRSDRPLHIQVKTIEENDDESVVCITDNGIGFDMSHANRIFDIFKRLHPVDKYSGTGIGLALCRRVVNRHGGRIWATSQPDVGTSFFFALPKYVPGEEKNVLTVDSLEASGAK